jgi:hypothetical protein
MRVESGHCAGRPRVRAGTAGRLAPILLPVLVACGIWSAPACGSGNASVEHLMRGNRYIQRGLRRAVLSLRERRWAAKALEGATARGPTRVLRSEQKDSAYVVTFQGGSSVWMRAMRKQDRSGSF